MLPNIKLRISGKKVGLEGIVESDLSLIVNWRNHPDINKWFFNTRDPPTMEVYSKWFKESYVKDPFDQEFMIKLAESNRSIGMVALYAIKPKETAEYGRIFIGPREYLGKGFASEATDLILDYGFRCFDLRQITLDCYADNNGAVNMYLKKGFKETKRYARQEDQRPVIDMVLTREDFERSLQSSPALNP